MGVLQRHSRHKLSGSFRPSHSFVFCHRIPPKSVGSISQYTHNRSVIRSVDSYIFLMVALILISTKSLSLLMRQIHLPQVVGALIAGVLLGPAVLNLMEPNCVCRSSWTPAPEEVEHLGRLKWTLASLLTKHSQRRDCTLTIKYDDTAREEWCRLK